MAPLYQHTNRQKIVPIPNLLDVNKSNLWYQADYTFQQSSGSPNPTMTIRYNASNGFTGYGLNFLAWQWTNAGSKTAVLKFKPNNIVGGALGLVFRSSANGKCGGMFALTVGGAYPGYGYGWRQIGFNDPPSSYQGIVLDMGYVHSADTYYWMKLIDDGTNITGSYSTDGVNYTPWRVFARSAYGLQTCDQVGFLQQAAYATSGTGFSPGSAGWGGNSYTIADFTCS